MRVILTPRAEADLEEIGDYIARDNRLNALHFITELRTHCKAIGDAPLAYAERPELRNGSAPALMAATWSSLKSTTIMC